MRLDGKAALVTGAGSGIGKHIAETFAAAGAAVTIADLDGSAATDLAGVLRAKGARALGVRMDVTSEKEVEAGVAKVVSAFDRVDILVSNAGIQIVRPIEALSLAEWKTLLAVHLDGAFLTTRECIKRMYTGGGGTILYMGSVHSKEGSPLKAPYVTAKHGLAGLCQVVAKEGAAHKVRAYVICPGFVRTPLVTKQIPEQARALGISEADVVSKVMLKETVDGEFTTLDDVAQVALFLAAFRSNALTGQSIVVSHGWHMQ
ncbi:MAG TPA: 3-hydroxybutyrate dehydrogenase [Burkholderiales bacterium]|nr:3-hydroxybutyrate dehydrogenase [Burkholderiales bacterium]